MPDYAGPSNPLSAEQLSRLEALFHEALSLPPDERSAWVDRHLAGDPEQARLLKNMLIHDEAETTGLSQVVDQFARGSAAPRDRSGEKIDRYRLVSRIRYGGMAEVYQAIRDDGQFDHEVALKVVRSDRVRPALNSLFAAERALMARLDHPHIIRIFDGGTTPQGEAYFVMELLDGLPLPAALSRHKCGRSEILGHLGNLCSALNHIHGKLVVHRDIKPENVLLCRTPTGLTVKLLDFGIAAQLSAGISPHQAGTSESSSGGWHSPGYTAPEALDSRSGGTAADIYSLGKLILDCASQLRRRDRKELSAIGEHASQTDPEQRYPGVAAIAEDLNRMRGLEPISLFRRRRLYVLKRALQRHVWMMAAALVLVVAGSLWLWRETGLRHFAEQATVEARTERDQAASMRDFLLNAYTSSNPRLNRGEEPRVSDLIIEQLELLESTTELSPDARIELMGTFGALADGLGRRDLADRAAVQALALLEDQGRQTSSEWIQITIQRGYLATLDGRYDDAAELYAQAEAPIDQLSDPVARARVTSMLFSSWGASEQLRGSLDEAERLIQFALAASPVLEAAGDPLGDDTAMRVTLGSVQSARRDFEGAYETFQSAYQKHLASGRDRTFEHLALLGWLGITLHNLERPEAESYLVEAVELAERLFPQPSRQLSGSYSNLGRILLDRGRPAEAEPLLRKAVEVSEAAGDAQTPAYALRLTHLGLLARNAERIDEAIDSLQKAHEVVEPLLAPDHQLLLSIRLELTQAYLESEHFQPALSDGLALVDALAERPLRVDALLVTARLAAGKGLSDEAEAALYEAIDLIENAESATTAEVLRWHWREGRAREAMGQAEQARTAYLAAAARYLESGRETHPVRGRALLRAALLTPAEGPERADLGDQARAILVEHLQPPAESLQLLESL